MKTITTDRETQVLPLEGAKGTSEEFEQQIATSKAHYKMDITMSRMFSAPPHPTPTSTSAHSSDFNLKITSSEPSLQTFHTKSLHYMSIWFPVLLLHNMFNCS